MREGIRLLPRRRIHSLAARILLRSRDAGALATLSSVNDWTRVDAVALGVLARCEGVARIDRFLDAGLTRYQVAALFRRGVLERPRIGWYVDPSLPWQVERAIRVGGIATCVTAAALLGIVVPPAAHRRIHVSVREHDSRLRHSRDRRRVVRAGDDDEVDLHWAARTDAAVRGSASVVDALLQMAWCVPADWFVAALDSALHRPRGGEPLLSQEDHRRFIAHLPVRFHPLLVLVNPLAGSPLETLLRLALDRSGIGWVALQFQAHPLHRVDLLLHGGVIVETDGSAFHDPAADAIRDAQLAELGYLVLRFTYDEIVQDLPGVLARIEAALATR